MPQSVSETLLVRDVMTVGVATCPPKALITDLARLMLEKNLEAVVVLDGDEGHAIGVVSQDELIDAYSRPDVRRLKAEDVLHEGVPQVPPEIPVTVAIQIMRDQKVRSLFIMHNSAGIEYPAAVISYRHVLRLLSVREDEAVRDLGIGAERKTPMETFFQRRDEARRRNQGSEK